MGRGERGGGGGGPVRLAGLLPRAAQEAPQLPLHGRSQQRHEVPLLLSYYYIPSFRLF